MTNRAPPTASGPRNEGALSATVCSYGGSDPAELGDGVSELGDGVSLHRECAELLAAA